MMYLHVSTYVYLFLFVSRKIVYLIKVNEQPYTGELVGVGDKE